jgi:succinate-semialdehyde dehydrogenase/glutarate-semialdehyde dehydrogenase
LIAWKVAGALAAGCTSICKLPSETPLSPLEFLRCIQDAGIPDGVVNALTGSGAEVGKIIMDNPKVKKVAFTGSTATGKIILANSVDTLKKVSLELGGSLPMIITKNADLDAAVAGATRRSFRNMGQICIAINRIYVDESVYEEFLRRFVIATQKLTIGNGLIEDVDLGPMCQQKGIEKTKNQIEDGLKKGARLLTGGKKPDKFATSDGNFFEPSILADVNHDMLVMKEETFGPLVGVMPYKNLEEAITLANDTVYGLAAMVYSNDLSEVDRLSKELQAGNVAINNPDAGVINAPYGGWKDSGFGHEHGTEGLFEYLYIKHIRVKYL